MDIAISMDDVAPDRMSTRLQLGVDCPARTPTSVQEFLTEQLQIPADYVRDRIQTLFLDGQVVDDLQASVVHDGSSVGLSAAMPGLVGATLRKSGYYAPMRAEINWSPDGNGPTPEKAPPGTVRVKLYNLILREQSRAVLARGVLLDRDVLAGLLRDGPAAMPTGSAEKMVLVRFVDGPTPIATRGAAVRVTVKLFAQFQKGRFAIRELDTPAGVLIQDILQQFEIPEKAVGVMMVNGRHATASRPLATGDVLAVFPVIGGG